MDGQDEVINNNNNNNNNNNDNNVGTGQSIVKGKRTKRQRPQSPIPFRMITTTTNTSYKSDEGSDICSNNNVAEEMTTGTTTTVASDDDDIYFNGGGSGTAASTTEEEEDMANCLILLAQGHSRDLTPQHPPLLSLVDDHQMYRTNNINNIVSSNGSSKFVSRKFMETPSTTGKSGYYVYECKTCGKTFSSFQALGGHRASHKKPKNKDEDYSNKSRANNIFSSIITSSNNNNRNNNNNNNSNLLLSSDDEEPPFKAARHNNNNNNNNVTSSTSLSLQLTNRALYNNGITSNHSNSKGRVHECSICGAEFSSGQALGGHMRRHRGPVSAAVGAATAPVIRAVPLSVEQAPAAATEMSEEMMITAMKIPPVRNTSTSLLSLDLDLNLPAPAEDNAGDHQRESKFVFESKQLPNNEQSQLPSPPPPPPQQQQQQQQQLVFSSPALVDCHY